jgi:microcystin-dependent protein
MMTTNVGPLLILIQILTVMVAVSQDPYLAEIKMVSFNFAPKGWALCNGQFLPINQNQALFSLLGTTYGGNGQTTFALPDLRGRSPLGFSDSGYPLGSKAGEISHTLTSSEMPAHSHSINAVSTLATLTNPNNARFAETRTLKTYRAGGLLQAVTMDPNTLTYTGGSQPHNNMPPYIVSFIPLCSTVPSKQMH